MSKLSGYFNIHNMQTLNIEHKDGIAIVQLNRGTSNPINLDMLQELKQTFDTFEKDDTVKAVVLTGKERFFSAGLDVIELYQYDEAKITLLFESLFETMRSMIAFSKPFVASITGHSPAGGCVLALCADYRIMAQGKYRIGLNEIPVGIVIPNYVYEAYAFWLGKGKASQYILEGKLATVEEALSVGLIDEAVEESEVLQKSIERAQFYTKFSAYTWQTSKTLMRSSLMEHFKSLDEQLKNDLLKGWWSKETRAILGALVEQLTKR
ncbi:MAG: enoyl-CoA hydratase/isomerase family protein [Chitinophagales bacterium]|nr:enoyl-CoA hydratase/isomerase family protein [Chitinophagales bacterium]